MRYLEQRPLQGVGSPNERDLSKGKVKSGVTDLPGREARLRPEFAHLYPLVTSGQWGSEDVMADRTVGWLLRYPKAGFIATEKILPRDTSTFAEIHRVPTRSLRVNRAAVIRSDCGGEHGVRPPDPGDDTTSPAKTSGWRKARRAKRHRRPCATCWMRRWRRNASRRRKGRGSGMSDGVIGRRASLPARCAG
jgi:hypothetical protein